jgi:tetratricopeptide (TPR) repeat protein
MHRKLDLRPILWACAILVPTAIAVHLLHSMQVRRLARTLVGRGDEALAQGQPAQALAHYAHYLGFAPDDRDAREKYVRLFDRRASPAERGRLVTLMQQLLLDRPDLHDLRFRLVHNLIAIGRLGEAIQQLDALAGHWPDPAELSHMIAWCQEARGHYRESAECYRAAIKLDSKRIDSYNLLAEVLSERLRDPEEAQRVLDAMVEANPKAYRAYLIRFRYYLSRGAEAVADRDLKAALDLAPNESEVVLAGAGRLQARGKLNDAYALLEQGTRHEPREPGLYKMMAEIKIRAGDRAAASDILARGLENVPNDTHLRTLKADLMIDQGEMVTAAQQVKELRRLAPTSLLPDYLQARIAMDQNRWLEATTLLQRCCKDLGPASDWASRAHALLGVCLRQAGDKAQALAEFRQALQIEPGWAAARAGLGAALLELGRLDEAIAELQLARTAPEPPTEVWTALARALLYRNLRLPEAQRGWGEVEAVLARARTAQPGAQEITVLEAEVLAARQDFAAARAALEKAIAVKGPNQATLWCALAELGERQREPGTADRVLAQAEAILGDRIEFRLTRCRLWSQRTDSAARKNLAGLADGLEHFDAADRIRLRRELADAWTRLGATAGAEELWRQVAAELPQDVGSRFAMVELALKANQLDKARALLADLRKLDGSQGMWWRYGTAALRLLEARTDRSRLGEARQLLGDLEQQYPDWGRVPLLQARADELEGRFDSAARDYERAVERGETQPGVTTRLVELLIERQEYLRAEAALGRYVAQRPLTPRLARLGAEVAAGNRNGSAARARARIALSLPSNDYRDYLWLAHIHHRVGDGAEAEIALRIAVQLANHAADAWVALVEHLTAAGRTTDAEATIGQAREKLPAADRALGLARCHEALHQLSQAETLYEQALTARPDDFIVLGHAAEFFVRQDRADRAEPLLRRLLTPAVAAPAEPAARARRQLAALIAPRAAQEALSLVPGASTADVRLRLYVRGQDPGQLPRVLSQFQESLERQPATPAERLLLSELCLAAGKPAQARAALQPLVAGSPLPHYLARYVRTLIRSDDLDDAAQALAKLERWESQMPRTTALREALQKARMEKK